MTDPPYGGGGSGSDGAAEGDLMLGLGDLDLSKLSREDKLSLECEVLKIAWVPTPPGATFCEHFWGETINIMVKKVVYLYLLLGSTKKLIFLVVYGH